MLEVAKEVVKKSNESGLLLIIMAAAMLTSEYIDSQRINNLHSQLNNQGTLVGTLQQEVTQLRHELAMKDMKEESLTKENLQQKAALKSCQQELERRSFIKVK